MRSIITVFLFIFVASAFADVQREEQRTWLGIFARKNIAETYDFWAETQLRHDESHQTMNQTLNRFGVLKGLGGAHEAGILFAYVQTGLTKEYRPTLQYVYKFNLSESTAISTRNRLEFRDIEDEDANSMRFRPLWRFETPFDSRFNFVLWDEPFLNLTHETWTGNRFIERNRVFIGTKVKFEKVNFEIGYMNQFIPRKDRDVSEHILTLYMFL